MRIDPSGLYPTRTGSDVAPDVNSRQRTPPPAESGPDSVTLSSNARLMAMARRALDESPPVRRSVVERARARLASDATWDGAEVAEAMMRAIAEDRA